MSPLVVAPVNVRLLGSVRQYAFGKRHHFQDRIVARVVHRKRAGFFDIAEHENFARFRNANLLAAVQLIIDRRVGVLEQALERNSFH